MTFRPLAGFWFLNFDFLEGKIHEDVFPSPCGVLVLKCVSDSWNEYAKALLSVPLRGSGS